ncbi:hypothetical protein [Streptomyces albidoflavus]|uniref:hypothetical protein n=1 Tax=Streptomyces albidoflavus TaxID=1886 RepID=UPI0033DD2109
MARAAIPKAGPKDGSKDEPKKETPAQKRAREALEAARATQDAPARRGEDDEPQDPPADEPPEFPHQADSSGAEAARQEEPSKGGIITPAAHQVWLGSENGDLVPAYTELPEDMDPLQQIATAKRGIARANQALTEGMGKLSRDYILSAGQWLWDVTERKTYKAAGHKSVEAFAQSVDLERHDVYRLRKAVPVYRDIHDLVEEPLSIRTIEEIFKVKSREGRREQFTQMKRDGRISAAGAIAARKLLALGPATEIIQGAKGESAQAKPVDRLQQAIKARRLVDVDLLAEVKQDDPDAAKSYVARLRESYEDALKVIEGE